MESEGVSTGSARPRPLQSPSRTQCLWDPCTQSYLRSCRHCAAMAWDSFVRLIVPIVCLAHTLHVQCSLSHRVRAGLGLAFQLLVVAGSFVPKISARGRHASCATQRLGERRTCQVHSTAHARPAHSMHARAIHLDLIAGCRRAACQRYHGLQGHGHRAARQGAASSPINARGIFW